MTVATCIHCRHPLGDHDDDPMDNMGCLVRLAVDRFCPCTIGNIAVHS